MKFVGMMLTAFGAFSSARRTPPAEISATRSSGSGAGSGMNGASSTMGSSSAR